MRVPKKQFARPMIAAVCGALCLTALPAQAAKIHKSPAKIRRSDPYHEFVSSCMKAFTRSGGEDAAGAGKRICRCTSKESIHQGVSVAALRRETARITKNPAYQIQDRNLLSSFQYCTIEAMRAANENQPYAEKITPVR